jgi:hypothetical protein
MLTRLRLRPTSHVILFRHSRWSKPLDVSPDTMANHRPAGGRLATPDHGTLAFKPTAIMSSVEISQDHRTGICPRSSPKLLVWGKGGFFVQSCSKLDSFTSHFMMQVF